MGTVGQTALAIAIPTVIVLIGILLNSTANSRIEAKLDRMQADLSQFYKDLGKHEGKIEIIERKVGL